MQSLIYIPVIFIGASIDDITMPNVESKVFKSQFWRFNFLMFNYAERSITNGDILIDFMKTYFPYGGIFTYCHFQTFLSIWYVLYLQFITSPNQANIAVAKFIKSEEKVATISSKSTEISEMNVFCTNSLLNTIVKLKIFLGSFYLVNYQYLQGVKMTGLEMI